MIFTMSLLKFYSEFDYPVFLFGEEIYFGEIAKKNNLGVRYMPEIKVIDYDHASTKKLGSKSNRYNYDAINKLIGMFYNE